MTVTLERRMTSGEVEVRKHDGKDVIEGHAAVFDRLSQNLGGFVERVNRGAFKKTITEADVRALMNHDENYVLGRNKSGTLELSEDNSGLYYRISPPDTTYARDLLVVMERGDITQSSFAFYTVEDDWGTTDQDFPLRDLREVKLVDVSPVTYPAYLDADSGVSRMSALAGLAKRSGVPITELVDATTIRKAITGEKAEGPSDTHSSEPNRWARRAQFMRDLERAVREGNM